MAAKRAPGGGRKPKGPFKGKTAVFTTRIRPEVRGALDRQAQRNNRSVSQEVEYRLEQSLEKPRLSEKALGAPRNRALGYIVARFGATIEQMTGENWREDKFTFEALKSAIDTVLFDLAPEGSAKPARRIERSLSGQAALRGRQALTPESVGASFAHGLLMQMEAMEKPPLNHPKNERYADEFYLMPDLRRDLGYKRRHDEDKK